MMKNIPRTAQSLFKKLITLTLVIACILSLSALPAHASNFVTLDGIQFPVEHTFTVNVIADGEFIPVVTTWGFSVERILRKADVTLGEEDRLSHPPGRHVVPGEDIRVERVARDVYTYQVEIPYETIEVPSSLFAAGRRILAREGAPGLQERTYSRMLVDGVVVYQDLQYESVISYPVSRRIMAGAPGMRVSPFDFQWERCEDGRPINYVTKLTNQRATAYCNSVGTITSTGARAQVGFVAVDPRVIPYGTLLYITSSCRTFVYGYAVAADTGGDLRRGRIDVDLFFDSRFETIHHGRRTVDIYILRLPS